MLSIKKKLNIEKKIVQYYNPIKEIINLEEEVVEDKLGDRKEELVNVLEEEKEKKVKKTPKIKVDLDKEKKEKKGRGYCFLCKKETVESVYTHYSKNCFRLKKENSKNQLCYYCKHQVGQTYFLKAIRDN